MKKNCHKCGDTGVNDLGNNDEPCDCPAGDIALFNDVRDGIINGKALKEKIANSIDYPVDYYPLNITGLSKKTVVEDIALKEKVIERPWGTYEILFEDYKCKIKQIVIYPECSISLQSHSLREELWKIIQGEGEVIVDGVNYVARPWPIPDSYFLIRRNTQHRITNTDTIPLVFIEIQTGESFDESDIIRYADDYGRVS